MFVVTLVEFAVPWFSTVVFRRKWVDSVEECVERWAGIERVLLKVVENTRGNTEFMVILVEFGVPRFSTVVFRRECVDSVGECVERGTGVENVEDGREDECVSCSRKTEKVGEIVEICPVVFEATIETYFLTIFFIKTKLKTKNSYIHQKVT